MSDEPTQVLEARCPDGHLLGTAWIPTEFLGPDEPSINFTARCVRCKVEVESVFVPLEAPAVPVGEPYSVWRRQRRTEFQVRCPSDRHRLARASIPVKFLAPGRPAIHFESRCCTCRETAMASFVGLTPTEQAPAASVKPRPAALRHV